MARIRHVARIYMPPATGERNLHCPKSSGKKNHTGKESQPYALHLVLFRSAVSRALYTRRHGYHILLWKIGDKVDLDLICVCGCLSRDARPKLKHAFEAVMESSSQATAAAGSMRALHEPMRYCIALCFAHSESAIASAC
jgi:hypothetical protein